VTDKESFLAALRKLGVDKVPNQEVKDAGKELSDNLVALLVDLKKVYDEHKPALVEVVTKIKELRNSDK
jgi:hypothetical protein